MPQRILVPLDGSAGAEHILDVLDAFGLSAGATLILLHTVLPTAAPAFAGTMSIAGPAIVPADVFEEERDASHRYLDTIRDRLGARGQGCETAVREGPPAETITAASGEFKADLVAMATHARTGLGRLLLGSVAEAVVRQVAVPVLTCHVPSTDEDEADHRPAAS